MLNTNLTLCLCSFSIYSKNTKQVALEPSTIFQLCSTPYIKVFECDVLALYGPGPRKGIVSPTKSQLVHAELVDKDRQMMIRVDINNHLIP